MSIYSYLNQNQKAVPSHVIVVVVDLLLILNRPLTPHPGLLLFLISYILLLLYNIYPLPILS